MMPIENRQAERLEAGYAITVRAGGSTSAEAVAKAQINNLSKGGLCFVTPTRLERGQRLEIDFPAFKPVVKLTAKVVWCRAQRDEFSVGAEFTAMGEPLRVRLIEMHGAIAEYQKIKKAEGNDAIDLQQVAAEWLNLYAEKYLAGMS